jgi:hypothetical protein
MSNALASTPYFDSLFDDFSIWQHADGTKPLPEHGYALDDATRGFLLCLALGRHEQAKTLFTYMLHSRKGDEFYGFYDDTRKPIQFPASEDAKGQVIWAMGYAYAHGFEKTAAQKLVADLSHSLLSLQTIRGLAYSILGAVYIDKVLAMALRRALVMRFSAATDGWFWPEDTLTYANGIIPYALLRYAQVFKDKEVEALGRKALVFVDAQCTRNRIRGPIGYNGWFKRGDAQPADDGQQAIDVTYMMLAWACAFQLSNNAQDWRQVELWNEWFEGENIAHAKMYDPATLKAYDGINLSASDHHNAQGVNYHSGAESNICLLLSQYVLRTRQII